MNLVTDVRTTQRPYKRASGRTRGVRVDVRVHRSGRTQWAYVRALTTFTRAHASRTYENKVDSSRPYFCTSRFFLTYLVLGRFRRTEIRLTRVDLIFVRASARDEWTCQRTYDTITRPSTRYALVSPLVRHASVHSHAYTYAGSYARPSPRSSALVTRRTISKITRFYEILKKTKIYR